MILRLERFPDSSKSQQDFKIDRVKKKPSYRISSTFTLVHELPHLFPIKIAIHVAEEDEYPQMAAFRQKLTCNFPFMTGYRIVVPYAAFNFGGDALINHQYTTGSLKPKWAAPTIMASKSETNTSTMTLVELLTFRVPRKSILLQTKRVLLPRSTNNAGPIQQTPIGPVLRIRYYDYSDRSVDLRLPDYCFNVPLSLNKQPWLEDSSDVHLVTRLHSMFGESYLIDNVLQEYSQIKLFRVSLASPTTWAVVKKYLKGVPKQHILQQAPIAYLVNGGMAHLPVEILKAIVQNLNVRDLHMLARTCKFFRYMVVEHSDRASKRQFQEWGLNFDEVCYMMFHTNTLLSGIGFKAMNCLKSFGLQTMLYYTQVSVPDQSTQGWSADYFGSAFRKQEFVLRSMVKDGLTSRRVTTVGSTKKTAYQWRLPATPPSRFRTGRLNLHFSPFV
ncbi:hypothetical protein B0H11DRAFT_1909796 [Mycena galericulata]|nr:hypothetical protein B0H11DRAFT_1909796 [Mycena galericulata]